MGHIDRGKINALLIRTTRFLSGIKLIFIQHFFRIAQGLGDRLTCFAGRHPRK
jgi:hypothetical protein